MGREKSAFVPRPFAAPIAVPLAPPPASVVAAPKSDTTRTRELFVSATKMAEMLADTPAGPLKSAAVPVASVEPAVDPLAPPPASVVTTPAGVMTRIL